MDDQNLEEMLRLKSDLEKIGTKENVAKAREGQKISKQTAEKNASLYDLMEMIARLVAKTMKEDGVVFERDEGSRPIIDPAVKVDHPVIYYQLISRVPSQYDLKARERDKFVETTIDKSERYGTIFGQKFKCIIQFDIMAPKSVNKSADKVMNNFEEMLFSYTHYFKKNGVAEFYFKAQMTDHELDVFRQVFSVRSIQYNVEIEKLTKVYDGEIFGVDS